MTSRSNKIPKVLLALEMANAAGRQQLIGIFRFLAQTVKWDFRIVQPPTELTEAAVAQATGERFDGIISALPCPEAACRRLAQSGIPLVLLDIDYPRLPPGQASVLRLDDLDIAAKAAAYFRNLGNFNEYAFIPAPDNPDWSARRGAGFRKALARDGHKLRVPRPDDLKSASALGDWLRALHKPAAILCANDTCAVHILEACHLTGVNVPEHVSILGVDDDEYLCELPSPAISSIRPDFENEGFQAAQELARRMSGNARTRPKPRIRAAEITERASTRRLAPATMLVNRGLAFIRQNARRNITVSAVVAHLGVSRRLADLRFRQIENKSILEEITEHRLNVVKQQLARTRTPIATITRLCGFSSPGYLKELFRRHCGMTMRDYRKAAAHERRPRPGV